MEANHKAENNKNKNKTTESSNPKQNKIPKYFISFKKPATFGESINKKRAIIKKAKSVTKKRNQSEASASKNNSILKYVLPSKNS